MREIKFRGKVVNHDPMTNPENGWVEGYYLQDLDNGVVKHYIFNCPMRWEVIPESVGQFTGLHDKNGKEIYEGDIICLCHFFVQYRPYEPKPIRGAYDVEVDKDELNTSVSYKRNYVVEFRPNRGWIVRNGSVHHPLRSYAGVAYGEVIGNIHDNPNLLTDGRD